MRSPFSFDGYISRKAYIAYSLAVFLSQYVVAYGFLFFVQPLTPLPWRFGLFWLNPLRLLAETGLVAKAGGAAWPWSPLIAMVLALIVSWSLVALAFRRAQSVRGNAAIAALAVVPVLQVLPIIWFSTAAERKEDVTDPAPLRNKLNWRDAAAGLLTGGALCILAVLVSAVFLRLYGYGLFVASPFVIGLTTAYIANRRAEISGTQTVSLVLAALTLGAIGLMGIALEGAICLLLAAPIIAAMGLIGAMLGRAIAPKRRRAGGVTLSSFAVVPLLLASEVLLPPRAAFESVESIDIDATPAAVWESLVHMAPIPKAPSAPFRWGLAYPMGGQIDGSGVGAIRTGVFSTGVAYERVTEWEPGRKLSFVVLSDPPTMRELSPRREVNAPHVEDYFRTLDTRFTIVPLSNGKTRLYVATQHELELEPALYWLPLAQWATHANKRRVLAHFQHQAEASGG